jgi:hypothetical protein
VENEITAEDVIDTTCDICEETVSVQDIEVVYNPVVGIRELCKKCNYVEHPGKDIS